MRRIVRCASRDGRNDRFRHRAAAGTVEPMAERRLYLVRHGAASGDGDDAELTSLGERQSDAIGRRLADVALTGVYHSPSRRAVQTAALIAGHLGGATPIESSLVADVIPSNPPRAALPAVFTEFLDRFSADQLEVGPRVARAALQRFASEPPEDSSELIVTHGFVVGWFVVDAIGAEPWRWLTLNVANAGLTTIRYRTGHPPALVAFNDTGHLVVVS